MYNIKLGEICKALTDGLYSIEEPEFMRIGMSSRGGRNKHMLGILLKIGVNLQNISRADDDYFLFLGKAGKNNMNEIIRLLKP